VSNAIHYDALLVRDLAAELDSMLAGCRLDAACLDRDALTLSVHTRAARRSEPDPPSLLWKLHPGQGGITETTRRPAPRGRVQLGAPTFIRAVTAPADERILVFELHTPAETPGVARSVIVELVTNQWNAIAVTADGRIAAVVRERRTGQRELRAGVPYAPPGRSERTGAEGPISAADWNAALGSTPPGERLGALVRAIAYTSAINAAWVLGDADVTTDDDALERARRRYIELVWRAPRDPVVLRLDERLQPYSRATGDVVERAHSILAALAAASTHTTTDPADRRDHALDIISRRIEAAARRIERLQAQESGAAAEAARLRSHADLLLAQLHRVTHGANSAQLDDFAGGTVRIELDPAQTAAQNATRMYDVARRRDRAAARVPPLVAAARREIRRLEALAQRVRDDAVADDEIDSLRPPTRSRDGTREIALPYRTYRTARGLEVRVGRGSRGNDELTFRHSAPNDIWLHARDVAGAHVILRWPRADENPATADITEAAVLAALFSRARTSAVVAVDWTRRKHVRKPRRAPPGLVVPERVKTVFVEPDQAVEQRMLAAAQFGPEAPE
jgi:predicted ribosome quality control (RQC) complex YloA/Tae2 family protein